MAAEAKRHVQEAKPNAHSYWLRKADADDFTRMTFQVPCDKSAHRLLNWLTEDSDERPQRIKQAVRMSETDRLSIHHVRLLAQAEDSELRRMVLAPIRARPTPEHRTVLHALVEDKDDGLRRDAQSLNAELEELRRRPLPARSVD